MKQFLAEDFLLSNKTAIHLYEEYAKDMPIIDYHCHLPPEAIASNKQFKNLTDIWLAGDHYKWRAMRALGINEKYITGDASDKEKFEKWAYAVPYTMRNPLYHWTHLELKRYFGIDMVLNENSAEEIYNRCNELIATPEFTTRAIQKKMKVETVCTTDDVIDSLEHHQKLAKEGNETGVFPTFRPDKILKIEDADFFRGYCKKLSAVTNIEVKDLNTLLEALKNRIDFFHDNGCRLSDHGLEMIYATDFDEKEVNQAISNVLSGSQAYGKSPLAYKSCILFHLGKLYHAKGWTQQFHLGALRDTNTRLLKNLGADCGVDSIGDFSQAESMKRYFDRLDQDDTLAKTILYNLNPADNEVFATMAGNYNDGSLAGKMQFGSGWWFLDQKDGMEKQMNALSNLGLLSQFVGMLTDSRSFLSYPRHEYFRRILCNLIGTDVENGELPNDIPWLGKMVSNICYYNAKNFFDFKKVSG